MSVTVLGIGTGRAVEVLHDRGPARSAGGPRWTGGSGYLIGSRLVLTAAHNVDYRCGLADDEQLLVRTIEGSMLAARVVLVCDEPSRVDLALLETSDPPYGEHLPPVTFAGVDRDSPAPVTGCWAVGFPRFGEAGPVLPEGSRRETSQVSGHILPGGKRRARLLSLQVTSTPRPLPTSLAGSEWEGMSGAVVFAADTHDGEQAAVGVISAHHLPEGESALTVVPVTAVADLPAAAQWWQQLGVPGPGTLPILPRPRAPARPLAGSPSGWLLAEVRDPFALEVHRPVQPDNPQPGLPELPAYVPRDHDAALGSVVRAAAEGSSGIAVLVGGSSTGKTRACWEALGLLRDQDPPWRLWHPIDPSRPDAALRELPGIGSRTVVWLNEAQFYLDVTDSRLGERVAAGLRELLRDPARAPVLALATMWPQFWDDLTARPAGSADPHAQARELLAGHDITVPAAFTAAQLQQLSRAGDARLSLAAVSAQDGQIIQFLAGAPELLARYRNAPPAAAALIHAAMDARRLGMGIGLPQAFLAAAVPGYLTDAEWDGLAEDWLEQALARTAEPAKGVRGPLTRIRPRPARSRTASPGSLDRAEQLADGPASIPGGPLYRLADYLDQYGRTHRKGQFPPADFWDAAADHASPADQSALSDAANARGLFRVGAQLRKNAAARGDLGAIYYLTGHPAFDLPEHLGSGRDIRPVLWAAAHAPLNDPRVVISLLDILRVFKQSAALLRRDPAAHVALDDPQWVEMLLDRLRGKKAHEQLAALAGRVAAHVRLDDPGAVARMLDSLRLVRARDQVAVLLRRDPAAHAALDDPGAVSKLLYSLREAGARDQVAVLLRRDPAAHAALDDPRAVIWLLLRLREAGAQEQADALAGRAVAHVALDDPDAVADLLGCLRDAREPDQVAALLRRDPAAHAALDDPDAVASLLVNLLLAPARDQVAVLLRRDPAVHVALDDLDAVAFRLLGFLRDAGAQEQVAVLAGRAVAHVPLDDPGAVTRLLGGLRGAGAHEQVAVLAGRAVAHIPFDDPGAVASLVDSLRGAGVQDQVAVLLRRDPAVHVALDDPDAVASLVDSLRGAGAQDQAAALESRAAAHVPLDDLRAVIRLVDSLRGAGARDQAAALAGRAAAHVPLDDLRAVASLVDSLRGAGARDQAAVLAGRAAEHAALDDLEAVARLLGFLRDAGAQEQVTALASRAAGHAVLDNSRAVIWLLDSLREAGAQEQAAALAERLPGEGMFGFFLEQEGYPDRFWFGREADGSPAGPWGWDDLK